jgi:hypothetical protein
MQWPDSRGPCWLKAVVDPATLEVLNGINVVVEGAEPSERVIEKKSFVGGYANVAPVDPTNGLSVRAQADLRGQTSGELYFYLRGERDADNATGVSIVRDLAKFGAAACFVTAGALFLVCLRSLRSKQARPKAEN